MTTAPRRDDERGAATVVAVAMLALLLAMAVGISLVGSAVIARHHAQAAADLAALAGAGRIGSGPQSACEWAASVATANRAKVTGCTVVDLDIVVSVEVAVSLGRLGMASAHGAARAGPAA